MVCAGDFTEVEIEKIQELRSRVASELTTKFQNENAFLVTWLRARNMNVDHAEEMLRKSLKWRKLNNVDGITEREEIPESCTNGMPFAYLGMERDTGCPVYLLLLGRYDFRSILEEVGLEKSIRSNILFMELVQKQMKENAKKVGKPVTNFIELMDLEGYSLRQMGTRLCREATQKMQAILDENYPECLKCMIMVNAPKIFEFIYNIMKPVVAKATLEKIEILGTDTVKWKESISKKIPMELVPRHWGGTLPGNDEYCSNNDIWVYGHLGPKFFSGGNADKDGFIKTKVKARDKFHIDFDVVEADVQLEWKFRTESHDIGFALLKDADEEIIPMKRVDSHKELQEGKYKCETTGTYKLIFDNTYSYARGKTLHHKIDITVDAVALENISIDKAGEAIANIFRSESEDNSY